MRHILYFNFFFLFTFFRILCYLMPIFEVFFIDSRKFESKELWTGLDVLLVYLFGVQSLNYCFNYLLFWHINAFVCFKNLTFDLRIKHRQTVQLDWQLGEVRYRFRCESNSETPYLERAHRNRIHFPFLIFTTFILLHFERIFYWFVLVDDNFQIWQHKVELRAITSPFLLSWCRLFFVIWLLF